LIVCPTCRELVEGAQKLFGPIQTLARLVVPSESQLPRERESERASERKREREREKFYRQSRSD
jgi:hypothetical protein